MDKKFTALDLPEVYVISPKPFQDDRGVFFESFNLLNFKENIGIEFNVLQENISISKKNVLRGLHFQKGKYAQSKLIYVIKGSIYDVVVDIRPASKNFGKWVSYLLDDKKKESLFVPAGFAHGFLALDEMTIISYKVNQFYAHSEEGSIMWNDKTIAINWISDKPILSKKDKKALSFNENYIANNF